jgi:glycosyltransferase involved in cell wall biosynthesis
MKIGVVVAQDFWMHLHDIYECLEAEHRTLVFRERRSPFQFMSERTNRFLLRWDLSRFMRSQDVTLFEWSEYIFVAATRLKKSSPIVTRLHSHELWDYAMQANWGNVDRVILVSHSMESRLLARFPEMIGRTHVVHNGVPLKKFAPSGRAFDGTVGTLGRIDPYKRIYDLILAIYQLRLRGYNLRLSIAGAPTEARYARYDYEVRRLVDRLHLQPYVRFEGPVHDTPGWFRNVDIFVSNSCSEGLQVALLEAMASGCYCLSHFWDGAEEALPPENLFVSDADLQARIMAFCDAPQTVRECQSVQMRQIAEERFDIDKQKLKVKKIVEDVARNGC